MQVPDFHSEKVPSPTHPFLFTSPAEVEAAKERIRMDPAFRGMFDALLAKAREDMETPLEDLDPSWWEAEREKPWEETYPIIFEKTWLQPGRMALPMQRLAEAWLLTGEERYASAAEKILLHLADYTFEFEHYDVGMNYSVWGYRALDVYDVLFDRLSADERQRMDAFFTRLGRAVLAGDVFWIDNGIGGGINNHLAWHKMTLGMLGLFYGQDDLVDYGLHGRRGIGELLVRGLVDDGLWCESSLNYHFAAVVPMTLLADVLRRTGYREDLFTETFADGRNLKQAYDAMFGVLFPDGLIPPVGDAYGHWQRLSNHVLYEYAYTAYGDPKYAWLLSRADRRNPDALLAGRTLGAEEVPDIGCRLFPEHGYVFLRSREGAEYWDSDAWCAFMTYDRTGVHANADRLGIMLFGSGRLLIPDVEAKATVPHAFSSRVQKELNRGALSQNTVMIDGRDQAYTPNLLTLVEYRDLPGEKRATAADSGGVLYPGVRQERTLCVTDDYVLDVFQVSADATREIEWIIHGPADVLEETTSLVFVPAGPRTDGAWHWIRDQREAKTDGDWWIEWVSAGSSRDGDGSGKASQGKARFRVTMAGEPGTRVLLAGYPMTDEQDAPLFPMVAVARSGRSARFAALYEAGPDISGDVSIRIGEAREGRFPVTVRSGTAERTHTIPVLEP